MCLLAILLGVLCAWQLLLPSAASAEHRAVTGATTAFPDKQGVSVVRLLVTYSKQGSDPSVSCTGVGAIVGSWTAVGPDDPTLMNTWILTDQDLLNQHSPSCGKAGGGIESVTVLPSATFTGPFQAVATVTPLASVQLSSASAYNNILFVNNNNSHLALLPLHLKVPEPYLNLDATDLQPKSCLDLRDSASTPAPDASPATLAQAESSLFVSQVPGCTSNIVGSSGMPLFNTNGDFIGIHTDKSASSWDSIDALKAYLSNTTDRITKPPLLSPPDNPVKQNWDNGMDLYAARHFADAGKAFKAIAPLNPAFTGAAQYANKADSQVPVVKKVPTPAPVPTPSSAPGIQNLLLLGLAALGVLILAILVIWVSIRLGRRRRELARFERERLEADRIAEKNLAERMQPNEVANEEDVTSRRSREARQPVEPLSVPPSSQPQAPLRTLPLPSPQYAAQMAATPPAVASVDENRSRRCGNCGQQVSSEEAYCPNCGVLVSPSASGIQRRSASNRSGEPGLIQQSAYGSPLPSATPPPSISDQNTLEYSRDPAPDPDDTQDPAFAPTQPYQLQQIEGRNLGLVVGTLTDPGIKRKYKPNEDSLFAVKGARPAAEAPQQFGLFVVADGMGGHANGRDASRLAIQTIINTMWPQLTEEAPAHAEDYRSLLLNGVQKANEAVYKRNQENRADAGTTMTAALVIGSTAYVANVGDSRTYIYREPEGLRKITNDHSVVASLVDAGIIKPDDIYTHPKRHQIYRSLGEKMEIEIDTFVEQLQPGDKLLLCSDGLWDMVRDPAIQKVMSQPIPDPGMTGTELVKAAYEGGGEDNVSVIVVRITEETERTGQVGIQFLSKPETVTLPELPAQ